MKQKIEINRSIQSFIATVYTMLSSSGRVGIERFEQAYIEMAPVIHAHCGSDSIDISAMVYSSLRLPSAMLHTKEIIFGQSEKIFNEHGISVHEWEEVSARARRRRYMMDGKGTLAAFISSKSDIDDLVPAILSFQIEWNKIHSRLSAVQESVFESDKNEAELKRALKIEDKDFSRMKMIWGPHIYDFLREAKRRRCQIIIWNLEASFCRYRKETDEWWSALVRQFPEIEKKPIYFVSSNTHSLINVLSGFAETHKDEILNSVKNLDDSEFLQSYWDKAVHDEDFRRQENFLYYMLKKFLKSTAIPDIFQTRIEFEKSSGIYRFSSPQTLDIPAQIIDIGKLKAGRIDRGLKTDDISFLKRSDALVLNIDYPLGRTAYFILSKIAECVPEILGVYIIGKAASLTGDQGDILLPELVHDLHTRNTYFIDNSLGRNQFEGFLETSSRHILDRQKAVTVLGTYIQNKPLIDSFFRSGFTDLEMEAGPYLSAIYEMIHPKRHPEGKNVLYRASDIELGIVHYVSDNPLRGKKLGDSSLALNGIEATYASTLAVAKRIFELERERVGR